METKATKTDEYRGMEQPLRKEAEYELRKKVADLRMDIFTSQAANSSKIRAAKKSLARLLTVNCEVVKTAPVKKKKGK